MPVPTIFSFLRGDHRRCDDLFAEAERLTAGGATDAGAAHALFAGAMERHFAMEETVLFPAFEQATGISSGPTAIMRHEHRQMRELLAAMGHSLQRRDNDAFLAASETLLVLMQQHNAKEEQILYPMADRAIPDGQPLIARMEEVTGGERR